MGSQLTKKVEKLSERFAADVAALGIVSVVVEEDVIELRIEGTHIMSREFFEGPRGFVEQAIESLDHFQDVISERLFEPWPTCPWHYHMMEPIFEGDFAWRCPMDRSTVRPLGSLGGLSIPESGVGQT